MRSATPAWLLAVVLVAGAANAAGDHVALFKNVTGKVSVVRDGARLDAVPGTTLFISNRLVSAPGASAGITFKDGTLLTLGPATELLVRDYAFEPRQARYAFSVYLAQGTAVYSSGRIGKLAPESVQVDAPQSFVAVRGTRFIIHAE